MNRYIRIASSRFIFSNQALSTDDYNTQNLNSSNTTDIDNAVSTFYLFPVCYLLFCYDDVQRLTKQPKLTAIFGHIMRMDDNADAKRILLASPPADWRRQLRRPRITWLSTVQQDLKQHHLTLPEAADLAQNRPLWRMMSTYGTYPILELHARNDNDGSAECIIKDGSPCYTTLKSASEVTQGHCACSQM